MSYIELTGKETEMGQYIDVQRSDSKEGEIIGIDIFLREGRVHIDEDDVDVLRKRLFELMTI